MHGYNPNQPLQGVDQAKYTYSDPKNPYTEGYVPTQGPYGQIAVHKPTDAAQGEIQQSIDDFKANQRIYNASQQGLFNIEDIQHDLDALNGPGASKAWNSGGLIRAREDLAKNMNAIIGFIDPGGHHPDWNFGTGSIDKIEDWTKNQTKLSFALGQSTGHQTDQINSLANGAVPNPELSPAGARLLTAETKVGFKYATALHDFQMHWQAANPYGYTVGSGEEFNRLYPPKYWANLALYDTLDPTIVGQFQQDLAAPGADRAKIIATFQRALERDPNKGGFGIHSPSLAAFAAAQAQPPDQ
jgi:hypothetical protein